MSITTWTSHQTVGHLMIVILPCHVVTQPGEKFWFPEQRPSFQNENEKNQAGCCQTESPAGYHWYPTSNPTQRGVETPWGWLQVSQGTGTWTCPVDGRAIAVLTDFHDFSNIKSTEFVCPVKLWQWEWNIYQKRPWPNDSAGQPRRTYEFPNGAMPRSACLRMPSHAQRPLAQLDGRRGCVMHFDARLIIQVYQGRGEWWYDGVMMFF